MFEFKKVHRDDPLLDEVYRLRYQVYCTEWGFERSEDHPGEIEKDEYDEFSEHFAAIRKDNGQLIGTVRLVMNSHKGFPIEKHCHIDADMTQVDRTALAEISRLAVSKDYRRRATDCLLYQQDMTEVVAQSVANERRKADNDIVIGLYRKICEESLERPLTHLYAVMAKGLYVLLKRIGFDFVPAGPPVEYHGVRTPYLGDTDKMIECLAVTNPEVYALFIAHLGKAPLSNVPEPR